MTIAGVVAACFLVFIEMSLHVVKVSLKYKSSIARNLMQEFRFYFTFKGMVKPALRAESEEGGSDKSRGMLLDTFNGNNVS